MDGLVAYLTSRIRVVCLFVPLAPSLFYGLLSFFSPSVFLCVGVPVSVSGYMCVVVGRQRQCGAGACAPACGDCLPFATAYE